MIAFIGRVPSHINEGGAMRTEALCRFVRKKGGVLINIGLTESSLGAASFYRTFADTLSMLWKSATSGVRSLLVEHPGFPLNRLVFLKDANEYSRIKVAAGFIYAFSCLLMMKFVCVFSGKKLVVDVHDLPSLEQDLPERASLTSKTLLRLYESLLFCAADRLWVVSPPEGDLIVRMYKISAGKMTVVPNGCFDFGKRREIAEDGVIRFLHAGSLFRDREVTTRILDIFSRLENRKAELYVCGVGGEWIAPLAAKNVRYLGALSAEDCAQVAANCDIGILPYMKEEKLFDIAHPVRLSFFVASGLAILSGDSPFIARMVREHDVGVVSGVTGMEHAVESLIGNPQTLAKFKENSAQIKGLFLWDHIFENVTVL